MQSPRGWFILDIEQSGDEIPRSAIRFDTKRSILPIESIRSPTSLERFEPRFENRSVRYFDQSVSWTQKILISESAPIGSHDINGTLDLVLLERATSRTHLIEHRAFRAPVRIKRGMDDPNQRKGDLDDLGTRTTKIGTGRIRVGGVSVRSQPSDNDTTKQANSDELPIPLSTGKSGKAHAGSDSAKSLPDLNVGAQTKSTDAGLRSADVRDRTLGSDAPEPRRLPLVNELTKRAQASESLSTPPAMRPPMSLGAQTSTPEKSPADAGSSPAKPPAMSPPGLPDLASKPASSTDTTDGLPKSLSGKANSNSPTNSALTSNVDGLGLPAAKKSTRVLPGEEEVPSLTKRSPMPLAPQPTVQTPPPIALASKAPATINTDLTPRSWELHLSMEPPGVGIQRRDDSDLSELGETKRRMECAPAGEMERRALAGFARLNTVDRLPGTASL